MKKSSPIGIFDSGVGGLSIWKEIYKELPKEDTIYLADSNNAPYGIKSKERIIELSVKNTELLLDKGCKLIVVACNTATTNAIAYLRKNYNVPFIGIEPAIKPAALQSKTKAIGVLATKGTLSSELFNNTSEIYAQNIEIVEQVGTGLVELIESGKGNSLELKNLLFKYLNPMLEKNIDHLVLGCTHYPFLIPQIKEVLPKGITIIDSGAAVAKQTKNVLIKEDLLVEKNSNEESKYRFYTNANITVMTSLLEDVFSNKNISFLDF